MPFLARCTARGCERFNLLEDEVRGQTVMCLVCKQPMPATPLPTVVRVCPHCKTRMTVPGTSFGQQISCPKCKGVFR